MAQMLHKSLNAPDEMRSFDKGQAEIFSLNGITMMRGTFEPGWRWSECMKEHAGTDLCEVHHTGFVQSGRMIVRMEDGEEEEYGPGDTFVIPPRHDAWIVGDEPCVIIDFTGGARYAT